MQKIKESYRQGVGRSYKKKQEPIQKTLEPRHPVRSKLARGLRLRHTIWVKKLSNLKEMFGELFSESAFLKPGVFDLISESRKQNEKMKN